MTNVSLAASTMTQPPPAMLLRAATVGLIAFLTVVDLFAAQAILPSLVRAYDVSPAAMSFAVNASTMGMAVSGLVVALLSRHINRRRGIVVSLVCLAVPTMLLGLMPDLGIFTLLRVAQGVFMAAAFTLALAYLGEQCSAAEAAGAFAAYITGNVASNLFGRLLSAAVADHFGLAANFYVFAALNLAGAVLVYASLTQTPSAAGGAPPTAAWRAHLANPPLRATFAVGFCILFAFIGTFTFVNFALVRAPFELSAMALGFVYFAFLPSIATTPVTGRAVRRLGPRRTMWCGLGLAALGLPLLVAPSLVAVLLGMVVVAIGTFGAQATATGFVGRAATADRGSASGIYLACYFLGGLIGTAVLGPINDTFGWPACVAGIGVALGLGALLAIRMRVPDGKPV
jgi:predicted MFS family arabinose efflux permease